MIYRIAGTSFCQDAVAKLQEGNVVTLVREPNNAFDKNAIRIDFINEKIGYIPRIENEELAQDMDNGKVFTATVVSTGRSRPNAPIGIIINIEKI